jgi:preprotein translocase subunit SecA
MRIPRLRGVAETRLRERARRRAGRKVLELCRAEVAAVNALEDEMRTRTDVDLRTLTESCRDRLADGEILVAVLPEVYAVVRDAVRRVFGIRTDDSQLMAVVALALPAVAETEVGSAEPTLTAVFPAVLRALAGGGGVHVMPVDDATARRDAERMGPVFHLLGMEACAVGHGMEPGARRVAYQADVTYGTAHEFGWDYLRDNLVWDVDECVQRGHRFAVVCDAEKTLIDECRTSLLVTADGSVSDSGDGANERLVLAEMTIRGYLDTYDELAAVTAAATSEASEVYRRLYHMEVVPTEQRSPRAVDAVTDRTAHSNETGAAGQARSTVDPVALERSVRYAGVLDEQCQRFYARRREILVDDDPSTRVRRILDEVVDDCVADNPVHDADDLYELGEVVGDLYPMSPAVSELVAAHGGQPPRRRIIGERIKADIHAAYLRREDELGSDVLRQLEQRVLLAVADRSWRDHLAAVRRLHDELSSLPPGTHDVLAEYQRRSRELFGAAEQTAREEAVRFLFHVDVKPESPDVPDG